MRTVFFLCALLAASAVPAAATEWWTARDGHTANRTAVVADLAAAEFVLLGETHDNPHHHAAQADLLAGIIAAGRRPAVVWEMVNRDRQSDIDTWAAGPRHADPDGFADAVGWEVSGWPAWALYRPIAEVAVGAGLPMVAGNLERGRTREVAGGGLEVLGEDRLTTWALTEALPPELRDFQADAVYYGHCELVPREALAPMVDVQVARDASMAAAMVEALERGPDGAVLIAGRGHVRDDVGVPVFLKRLKPDARIATVGPTEGPSAGGPFDWRRGFPAVDRPDPCEQLRQHFKKKRG